MTPMVKTTATIPDIVNASIHIVISFHIRDRNLLISILAFTYIMTNDRV
jgi:branched-subunit amino acid transport protein AzlD